MGHFNSVLTNCMGLEGSSSILVFRLEDNYLNKQKKSLKLCLDLTKESTSIHTKDNIMIQI